MAINGNERFVWVKKEGFGQDSFGYFLDETIHILTYESQLQAVVTITEAQSTPWDFIILDLGTYI